MIYNRINNILIIVHKSYIFCSIRLQEIGHHLDTFNKCPLLDSLAKVKVLLLKSDVARPEISTKLITILLKKLDFSFFF